MLLDTLLKNPLIQYGALGLAFLLAAAMAAAFFRLLTQQREQQAQLFRHHSDRERAFTDQFLACIDRNSAALEKVEQGLQQIRVELARGEGAAEARRH